MTNQVCGENNSPIQKGNNYYLTIVIMLVNFFSQTFYPLFDHILSEKDLIQVVFQCMCFINWLILDSAEFA